MGIIQWCKRVSAPHIDMYMRQLIAAVSTAAISIVRDP